MAETTKTLKLDAVNTILSTVGEQPVASLTSPPADVALAIATLEEVCRTVNSGFHAWNTRRLVNITSAGNAFTLPANAATVEVLYASDGNTYVQQGDLLYNLTTGTSTVSNGLIATVNVAELVSFEQMPEPARRYCMIRAARLFNARGFGASDIHAYTKADEDIAEGEMMNYDFTANPNTRPNLYSTGTAAMVLRKGN